MASADKSRLTLPKTAIMVSSIVLFDSALHSSPSLTLATEQTIVVVSAKTTSDASLIPASEFPPSPNSSASTINTVVREITESGHSALALACDVRDTDSITSLVGETISNLGSVDVLVYNSGAIWWSSVETTPLKRFQLMQAINPTGLYAAVQACLPHFATQNWIGRIIVVSPPIYSRFFRGKTAYAMGKVGMSVLTKGLAMDFERQGRDQMAITSLWPAASIESAATESAVKGNQELNKDLRKPTIFSEAVLAMVRSEVKVVNGLCDTDEDFLRKMGRTQFGAYSVVEGSRVRRIMPKVFPDLTVEEQDDEGRRVDSVLLREKRSKL